MKTRLFTLLSLGGALFVANIAHAQTAPPSGAPGAPGSLPASSSTAPAPGSVTNQTTTQSTTTQVPATEVITETTESGYNDGAPLENTGGEPWMFVLGGLVLAGSALAMRRRVGNQI